VTCRHCGADPIPASATHAAWLLRQQAERLLAAAEKIDRETMVEMTEDSAHA